MDLLRLGDHRFTLHRTAEGTVYLLRLNQPHGEAQVPRRARRYDLPDRYSSLSDATADAKLAAQKLEAGELSFISEQISKRVREYEVVGSVAFLTGPHLWQPILRIVSHRARNRGAVQDLGEHEPAVAGRLFDRPSSAAKHSIDIGERMVLGLIGGLRV